MGDAGLERRVFASHLAYFFFGGGVFPGWLDSKVSAYSAGDPGSIPGSGRSGEGNGNPFQYSCLENPIEGEAWWTTVHGVEKRVRHD